MQVPKKNLVNRARSEQLDRQRYNEKPLPKPSYPLEDLPSAAPQEKTQASQITIQLSSVDLKARHQRSSCHIPRTSCGTPKGRHQANYSKQMVHNLRRDAPLSSMAQPSETALERRDCGCQMGTTEKESDSSCAMMTANFDCLIVSTVDSSGRRARDK